MKKAAVYTKTGDKGETSLVSGTRITKSDQQIDLYGDLDELNSHVGYLTSLLTADLDFKVSPFATLNHIQHKLFDLGSLLACESDKWDKFKLPKVHDHSVELLENDIDKMDVELTKLRNFILPGGSQAGSYCHIARTVCRRCERKLIAFMNAGNEVPKNSLEFLNRMSDYFFVLGRYINLKAQCFESKWEKEL